MHRPYDNAQTVADEAAILADFAQRSQDSLAKHPHQKNLVYGNQNRQSYDFFACDKPQGTVVFIHGGYWQWCEKEDFAFVAPYCLAQNWQCLLIEYPLAPKATMGDIVDSVALALEHLQQRTDLGKHIIGIGHSAGAHLLAMHQHHTLFDEVHLLSGLYDLSPIAKTHLNDAIKLSEIDISKFSPMSQIPLHDIPIYIAYGQDELPELTQQSGNYGQILSSNGCNTMTWPMPDTNHYTILDRYFAQHFSAKTPCND